jgi:hypothetical protein
MTAAAGWRANAPLRQWKRSRRAPRVADFRDTFVAVQGRYCLADAALTDGGGSFRGCSGHGRL